MNWTIDQLIAFVSAVETGSFSAAARRLGKAQSRVSTAIAHLEADLGIELFDRSGRLPILTETGQQLYEDAKGILQQCERLQAKAGHATQGQEIALTIAIDEAVPVVTFEDFFTQLASQFPDLKLTIINGSQDDIALWVDEGRADVGMMFYLNELPSRLEFTLINDFKQTLVVAKEHPLAMYPIPTIEQLNQYRQLVIRDRIGNRSETPISSRHWHIDSYYHITALVLRNIGWALIPEHVARAEWYIDDLVELSTDNIFDSLWVEMGIVKRRDKAKGPVMVWIYQQIRALFDL
ncbi:LysR family transcriptional regulator [Photobacterium damselae]|nr:LysR family transcriptional regulator [Photobacterium damselae]PSB83860.1 LysR family transcriptional regulator [Photobacterium damselae subsp. damselae]TLS66068.1 LysR family transcriptional regulator [Photobacterium damselae subsp. damselae]